jgi:hypothetical protein
MAQSRLEQGLAGAEDGSGKNRATMRTRTPAMSTALLGSEIAATVIAIPASDSAGRGYFIAVRARRITAMIVSSAPVRSHQRIRPRRADRVLPRAPGRAARPEDEDEDHTTIVRRRSLTAASRTHESALLY